MIYSTKTGAPSAASILQDVPSQQLFAMVVFMCLEAMMAKKGFLLFRSIILRGTNGAFCQQNYSSPSLMQLQLLRANTSISWVEDGLKDLTNRSSSSI